MSQFLNVSFVLNHLFAVATLPLSFCQHNKSTNYDKTRFRWVFHSTLLMRYEEKTFLCVICHTNIEMRWDTISHNSSSFQSDIIWLLILVCKPPKNLDGKKTGKSGRFFPDQQWGNTICGNTKFENKTRKIEIWKNSY